MLNAVVLAGGVGSRMKNALPKQFLEIEGKPLIVHTLEAVSASKYIDDICVVCHHDYMDRMRGLASEFGLKKVKWIVPGGSTGLESTYNGLKALSGEKRPVMVHDGNRPLIDDEIIGSAYSVYLENGNAVSAIPCVEVVYESEDGLHASGHLDRDRVVKTHTPQIYDMEEVLDVYRKAEADGLMGNSSTTELYYALGKQLFFAKGSGMNIKITYPEDLLFFETVLKLKHREGRI